jgi:flagella basal body P-ring formation protein FlgA
MRAPPQGSIRHVKDRSPSTAGFQGPRRVTRAWPADSRAFAACLLASTLCTGAARPAAASPPPPATTGLPAALPAADLARALALVQQTAQRLAPSGAQVSATLGTLERRLNPAPCRQAEPFLPRSAPPWGRTRVGLRCTAGAAWTLYLPVQVQVVAEALAVRTAVPAGSVLSAADLTVQMLDWSARPQPPLTDPAQALGRKLQRAATPGVPLLAADLQVQRWFAAGDTVKVRSAGAGFAVATEGVALNEGRDGQRVRVQLPARSGTGRSAGPVLQGYAVGERLVELP